MSYAAWKRRHHVAINKLAARLDLPLRSHAESLIRTKLFDLGIVEESASVEVVAAVAQTIEVP